MPLPLLFVHGAGGNRNLWKHQTEHFAGKGHRVHAVSLPGHGDSPGPGRVDVGEYAEWVAGEMDRLGWPRAVVLGHSMGGAIAQTLALDHPSRVAGIVLVATGARIPISDFVLQGIRQDFEAAMKTVGMILFSKRAAPEMVKWCVEETRRTPGAVLVGDLEACTRFDVSARLGALGVPALVIGGRQDVLTAPRLQEFLARSIPGARLEMFEDAGHMVMAEQAPGVNRAIEGFLQGLPAE
ncbi:MAG: alpha/beta hydrolase [Euryarchaeota archaeon]|nr:alpha/beta hydrolase [Euryarchaeota archaeon]